MYKFIGLAGLASGAVAGILPRGGESSIPSCWSACFEKEGVTSESALCGNTAVDACIQDGCSAAEDKAYWAWYEEYCPTPTSSTPPGYTTPPASYSAPSYSWSWSASSSSYPASSAAPTPTGYPCWGTCFAKEHVTSEADLCGNTAVDACIQDECDAAADKAYWSWYESYCPATSTPPTSTVPAQPTSTPSCWAACFQENGITAESQLCGNTAVDACIQAKCSAAEDKAYWAWYEEYCGGGSPTSPATGSTVTTWATVTSCSTYSSVWTSGTETGTTYWTSAPPAPAPTSPVAPYPTAPGAPPAGGAWGTGTAAATASGWVAPATGAGAANKPAFALAGVIALAAFFH